MAEQHGGKRTPRNPAPVSGPGKLSRRTDGGPAQVNAQMTGMAYGENKDFMQIQEGAAMAATPKSKGAMKAPQGLPMGAMGGSGSAPLFSETQRPDEPVTAGVNFGPGAGAPTIQSNKVSLTNVYQKMANENANQEVLDMLALAQRLGY